MASITHIASQTLTVGGETSTVAITMSGERIAFNFAAAQVGSIESLTRLIIRDANNNNLKTVRIVGTDTQRVVFDSEILISAGALSVWIECLAGSALVSLVELTGSEGILPGTGTTIELDDLADDFFTAAAAGRAKLTDDFFTAAEFVAGAGGKFAPDCFDAAACANVFDNGAIPAIAQAAAPFGLETVLADPGAAGAIPVASNGVCSINIAAPADDRTLAIPTFNGQVLMIVHTAGANAGTVTSAQAVDSQGTDVLNFAAELGQWVLLIAKNNGAALRWDIKSQGRGVTSHTPVYTPNVFADPGNAGAVPVTNSGRCAITTAGGGENRTLADPAFEGQRLTLESVAANAAHSVTCATAFDPEGAALLYFQGGINEQVTLEARMVVAALVWRIAVDDDLVSHYIPAVADAAAIPVTRKHTIWAITTGAGAETNTLAIPTRLGQTMTISCEAHGGGDRTITVAGDLDAAGNNLAAFNAAGDALFLKAVTVAAALVWRLINNDGCTLA